MSSAYLMNCFNILVFLLSQVRCQGPGAPGLTGPRVARLVVEDLSPDRDSVTVQLQHMAGKTVTGRKRRLDSAALITALVSSFSIIFLFFVQSIDI